VRGDSVAARRGDGRSPTIRNFKTRQAERTSLRSIKSRLIANLDPDEWDLPPKPQWMRWKTYERYEMKFDRYEEILDYGCARAVARLRRLKIF